MAVWFCAVTSGWYGLFTSAMSVCSSNKKKSILLNTMGVGMLWSLFLRLAMITILTIYVHKFRLETEDYDACVERLEDHEQDKECNDKLTATDNENQDTLEFWFRFCLVITVIWTMVSITGIVAGYTGGKAEKAAERDLEAAGGGTELGVVGRTPSGVPVVMSSVHPLPVRSVQPVVTLPADSAAAGMQQVDSLSAGRGGGGGGMAVAHAVSVDKKDSKG